MNVTERCIEMMTGPNAGKAWRDVAIDLLLENDRLRAERLKLEQRIHNQRVANRENWQIVERRANCLGTKESRATLHRHMRWLRDSRDENKVLRAALTEARDWFLKPANVDLNGSDRIYRLIDDALKTQYPRT